MQSFARKKCNRLHFKPNNKIYPGFPNFFYGKLAVWDCVPMTLSSPTPALWPLPGGISWIRNRLTGILQEKFHFLPINHIQIIS
jgi:hypothetical protein